MSARPLQLAVIGGASCDARQRRLAVETGREIALCGAILLCGGRGGVMEGAAQGARESGGRTVGILPGADGRRCPPNPHVEIVIYTGMGQARNQILVLSAGAVIGIGGSWGTLTEIGLALKHRIPVILLESWRLSPPDGAVDELLTRAATPAEAVSLAIEAAGRR